MSLGFNQLAFPFGCLCIGVVLGIVASLVEHLVILLSGPTTVVLTRDDRKAKIELLKKKFMLVQNTLTNEELESLLNFFIKE